MKICFLTHNLDIKNGAGRLSHEFALHLQKLAPKTEIKFLTTVKSGHEDEEAILYPNKIKLFFSLLKIRRILKHCDVIHAFDGVPYGVIAALALVGLKNKLVITAIGSGSLKPLYTGRSFLLKWSYKKADKLIAISSYTAGEIMKKVNNINIEVIPHGINYEYFNKQVKDEKYLEDVKKLKPYLLSVGKIKPRKGYDVSLKVFAKILEKNNNLNYVIVGSGRGEYYEELQKLIKDLKIENKVFFKKNISDEELACLYRQAELFLLLPQNISYDVEGFGLVFLEAAAFGLPVIGSRDSGAQEAIWNKNNGFLVDSKDINSTSKLISDILNNPSKRQKFSRNSLEFAKKMSWSTSINKYLEIYKNL